MLCTRGNLCALYPRLCMCVYACMCTCVCLCMLVSFCKIGAGQPLKMLYFHVVVVWNRCVQYQWLPFNWISSFIAHSNALCLSGRQIEFVRNV